MTGIIAHRFSDFEPIAATFSGIILSSGDFG
jgi:hypothetical protein